MTTSIQRALEELNAYLETRDNKPMLVVQSDLNDLVASLLTRTRQEVLEEVMERMPEEQHSNIPFGDNAWYKSELEQGWNAYHSTLLRVLKEMQEDNTKDI